MANRISIGEQAPNFDLTSTENCLLMLRDEVPRTAVVLYVFADPASERTRRDLVALSNAKPALRKAGGSRVRGGTLAKPLAMSRADLATLQKLQAELKLSFPLLHDDRDFSAGYGVEGAESAPALYVINRQQKVLWLANPVASVESALPEILTALRDQGSPTGNYPRTVINRMVDRWVN